MTGEGGPAAPPLDRHERDVKAAHEPFQTAGNGTVVGSRQIRDREIRELLGARCGCSQGTIEGRFDMTDLERLGLALVGFAVAVVSAGVLLGLIGAWIKRGTR